VSLQQPADRRHGAPDGESAGAVRMTKRPDAS
jgi:hypothetical protein